MADRARGPVMVEEHPEITRAGNAALRNQIEQMLNSYERDISALETAQARATEPVTVWSADNLVRVTANIAGVIEVHLEPDAFKRSSPEKLGVVITETVRDAGRAAARIQEEALAPLTDAAAAMPDLPDLIPGAPATKDLLARFVPPPVDRTPPPPPAPAAEDDDDDYYRNQGYLR
ncbi:YbaB/EbfC family nucleoid-associated protein [Nocardia sp. NBC_01377]|uniref:YbaB/EbfC family nucleoid-associated protein n=1 Tax=Nocardia sp. NBC_01377 TaxID=2903595 RepID=UPI003869C3F3